MQLICLFVYSNVVTLVLPPLIPAASTLHHDAADGVEWVCPALLCWSAGLSGCCFVSCS